MVFVEVNPSGLKLLRYENKEQVLMQSPAQLSPAFQPDGRPSHIGVAEAVTRAIRDGSHQLEWLCRRYTGECFPAEVSLTPLEPGQTPLLAVVVRDITDRKASEDALRAERARMKATLDVAIDCIVTIDAAGMVLEWNPATERTFGWSREEAVGREMADFIIPHRLRGRHREGLERAVVGENRIIGQRVELPALHRDGHTFPVELSISRVETGGVPIFTGFIRDITERKRVESQMFERADRVIRYQTALMEPTKSDMSEIGSALQMVTERDALTMGVERVSVWFFDGQKSAIVCRDLFSIATRQHSEGATLAAAGYPRYFAALAAQRTIAAQDAASDPATSEFREGYLEPLGIGAMLDVPIWRNGQMIGVVCHEHVGGQREWSHEEQQFAASVADIIALALEASERKQAEAETARANASLERHVEEATAELRRALEGEQELGRMKTNFVNLVSHEFRTPLGVIMSSTEILSKYFERLLVELRQEHLNDVIEATRRMSTLMEEVLLLARADAGRLDCKPEPVDLGSFCSLLADDVFAGTGHKCPIELTISSAIGNAAADPAMLRHIFTNLLSNAVKYSPAGAPVRFTTTRVEADAVFCVSDCGIGIPERDMQGLFTAFHRGSNVSETAGTGLGLVIVKRCTDLHGGSIEVQSVVGEGTTFTVRLPLFG